MQYINFLNLDHYSFCLPPIIVWVKWGVDATGMFNLRTTRRLTKWFEIVRTKNLTAARDLGNISTLYLELRLGEMGYKLATRAWLKHAGMETSALWEAGKIKNMVLEIPMVQTRFKLKVAQYLGAQRMNKPRGWAICQMNFGGQTLLSRR